MADLTNIPGIGKTIAANLTRINISKVEDFTNQNPEELYEKWCIEAQNPSDTDKCILYVFRTAVYYANGGREPEKLKWWNWKDTV